MVGLAMRTPHHCRPDLPRAAYMLECGIQSVTERKDGVYGHRRIGGLPEHRDHLWEPDLLGIAGRHHEPLPCRSLLGAVPRCAWWAYGSTGAQREEAVVCGTASCTTLHEGSIRPCPTLDEHTILAHSYGLPGSSMTSNSMSAGGNALPCFLVLGTSGCIALLFAQICQETGKE